jgi:hypothetical protein
MNKIILPITSVVATQEATTNAPMAVLGRLYAIEYRPNNIATGADLTITCIGSDDTIKPLLTVANAGTNNVWFYPRDLQQAVANGADLDGSSGGDRCEPILQGVVRAHVDQAGATTVRTGTIIIYWEAV